jgi:hypothetical protein
MTTAATTDQLADMQRTVRELVDRHELAELVHRLGTALDDGRFEELRTIFVPDATARTPGGTAEGLDAMIAQAARNHSPDEHIQHVISDVLIDLDGDRASLRAKLVVTFSDAAGSPGLHTWMGERYRFDAGRTAQGWRLTSVATSPVWAFGAHRPGAVAATG